MKAKSTHTFRVLGIYPCSKGFGFAVLESRGLLVSWGIARLYSANEDEYRQRLEGLWEKYRVRIVSLERVITSRRAERARHMIATATECAAFSGLYVVHADQAQLRLSCGLGPASSRYDVATRISQLLPELEVLLPPPRKPWQPEDERIGVFFAAALAVFGATSRGVDVTAILRRVA